MTTPKFPDSHLTLWGRPLGDIAGAALASATTALSIATHLGIVMALLTAVTGMTCCVRFKGSSPMRWSLRWLRYVCTPKTVVLSSSPEYAMTWWGSGTLSGTAKVVGAVWERHFLAAASTAQRLRLDFFTDEVRCVGLTPSFGTWTSTTRPTEMVRAAWSYCRDSHGVERLGFVDKFPVTGALGVFDFVRVTLVSHAIPVDAAIARLSKRQQWAHANAQLARRWGFEPSTDARERIAELRQRASRGEALSDVTVILGVRGHSRDDLETKWRHVVQVVSQSGGAVRPAYGQQAHVARARVSV